MAAKGEFDIKIEDDGTLTIVTDRIAPEVHAQADELMAILKEKMGGTVKTEKSPQRHHHHKHGEQHHHH